MLLSATLCAGLAYPTLRSVVRRESRCSGPGFELLLAFPRSPVALKEVSRMLSGSGDCHVIINNLALILWVDRPGRET